LRTYSLAKEAFLIEGPATKRITAAIYKRIPETHGRRRQKGEDSEVGVLFKGSQDLQAANKIELRATAHHY
jgi:hypothetical protein